MFILLLIVTSTVYPRLVLNHDFETVDFESVDFETVDFQKFPYFLAYINQDVT